MPTELYWFIIAGIFIYAIVGLVLAKVETKHSMMRSIISWASILAGIKCLVNPSFTYIVCYFVIGYWLFLMLLYFIDNVFVKQTQP